MSRVLLAVLLGTTLAGCATRPVPVAVVPPPVIVAEAPPPAPPPISPINSNLSQAGTVWHLRAALNVAALACRGADEAAIIARYNALLATNKAPLAAAEATLASEFRAAGGDWRDRYDDAMTRLYNFFSQAQARDAFCTAAADVLAGTGTVTPETLAAYAAARLPELDAPFAAMLAPAPLATPVIAVAAALPAQAPVATVAQARPMPAPAIATRTAQAPVATVAQARPIPAPATATRPAPRLELDLSALQ